VVDVSLENGKILHFGHTQFTGIGEKDFVGGRGTYYPQEDSDLNRSNTFLGISSGGNTIFAGASGSHWGQNIIHNLRDLPIYTQTNPGNMFLNFSNSYSY
jgi:hypothetical protein